MSLSEQTVQSLQALMAQDSELLTRIQAADASQAVTLITDAATQKGIAVNAAELQTYFSEVSQAAASQALSDAQLEAVAAGWSSLDSFIGMSIVTLGMGCALVSLVKVSLGGTKVTCQP